MYTTLIMPDSERARVQKWVQSAEVNLTLGQTGHDRFSVRRKVRLQERTSMIAGPKRSTKASPEKLLIVYPDLDHEEKILREIC